jgi:chromate transporter
VSAWLLYVVLLRATLTSFSGLGSVALIREDLVARRAVLTDQELNGAIAIGQISPGPLGLYVVVVGYFVGGVPGAIAGMLALATPAFLAIPIASVMRRGGDTAVRGVSGGILIASSVLILMTAGQLAGDAVSSLPLGVIAVVAGAILATGRVSPLLVVIGAALLGLLVSPAT